MRFLLFAALPCACGGVITNGDAATNDASADVVPLGELYFQQQVGADPLGSGFVGTFFANAQQSINGCQPEWAPAGCSVVVCTSFAPPSPSSLLAAGTLTLSGGMFGEATVTEGGDGNYRIGGAFAANDLLGVSASGGTVPAFATQTVVAPGMITLTSPHDTLSATSDVVFTWIGGEPNADVIINVFGEPTNAGTTLVTCKFDGAAGTGTLPSAELVNMSSHAGLLWGQERGKTFLAGTYPIRLGVDVFTGAPVSFQ